MMCNNASKCAAVAAALLLLAGVGVGALRQSPIDIVERRTVLAALPPLEFFDYDTKLAEYVVENTGHSAQLSLDQETSWLGPSMAGGPLPEDSHFKLQQVHFHWGSTSGAGSEHLLNGKAYSMEVHLVHYNENYGSFEEAAKHQDGLAVIGFFIEGGSRRSSYNRDFQRLVRHVSRVAFPQDKVPAQGDLLSWLRPHLRPDQYFTYDGSLTTEPYSENVNWIVYRDPIEIHSSQINAFRRLHGSEHELTENFREIQPLNGRVVEFVP